MATRAIVYESHPAAMTLPGPLRLLSVTPQHPAAGAPRPHGPKDDYASKLAKYVPGEVLTLFLTLTGIAAANRELVWGSFIVGVIAAPVYLGAHARNPTVRDPRWYMYVLAALGFAVWAFTTSDALRTLAQVSDQQAQWVLTVTVFALPVVDGWCVKLFGS